MPTRGQPAAPLLNVWPRILPDIDIRTLSSEQFSLKDVVWDLTNEQTKERTAHVQRLTDDHVGGREADERVV